MPPKHASRDRAWGTRYDTLTALSPPSSPPTQRLLSSTASPITHSPSSQNGHENNAATITTPTKPNKTSHDSSIFVGSLPSTMDLSELQRLLTDHLSEYPEIKSVKVVRDVKGGVCAFAQCDNAPSAGRLLEILQTTPQRQFLGRYLRFEMARAFRTLLMSYRAPSTPAYPNSGLEPFEVGSIQPDSIGLPTAMRLHKPSNNKFCAVAYNSDALNFEVKHDSQAFDDVDDAAHPLSGAGLCLSPLKFDGETLHEIAQAFGAVEHFGIFVPNVEGSGHAPDLRPHSGPRTADMDLHIWEVKWEQRDNAMKAHMTLRDVPHLVVTWAHRAYPDTGSGWESRFGSPTVASSPRFPPQMRSRTQSRSHYMGPNNYQSFGPQSFGPSMTGTGVIMDPATYVDRPAPHMTPFAHVSPVLHAPSSPLSNRATMPSEGSDATLVPDLSDGDFPPLHERRASYRPAKGVRAAALPWVYEELPDARDDVFSGDSVMRASPSSSLSVQPSTPTPANTLTSPGRDASNSEYEYTESVDDEDKPGAPRLQDLIIPLTPDFTTASITPRTPKTALSFPHTPQSGRSQAGFSLGDYSRGGDFGAYSGKDRRYGDRDGARDKEIDPFSVFAGTLDTAGPNPWDEDRVKDVFGKYGEIEDIQLIKRAPFSGFAFVRYTNTTDSNNAVKAEHLRSYDGRPIRVKLREINLPRGTQRFNKNKPRGYCDFSSGYHGQFDGAGQVNDGVSARFDSSHDVYRHGQPSGGPHYHQGSNAQAPEDDSPPVFPSIAAPEFKPPTADTSFGQRRPLVDASNLERPVSSLSGSVSSHPSSTGGPPSVIVPAAPYPMAYPSWAHHAPYGYGSPYGHMGYPPPPMGYQPVPHSAGADGYAVPQYAWSPHMYQYRVPYPQPPASAGSNGDQNHAPSQPPVKPVGFMADQGSLVPMYPQEALNQYMTSSAPSSHSPPPTGVQPAAQAPQPMPTWAPYMAGAHAMGAYPYVYPPPMGPSAAQQSLGPHGQYAHWYPPPAPGQYYQQQAPPTHAVAPAQGVAHGPPPPYSASTAAMTPSNSYRAPSYGYPPQPSHSDGGLAPRHFPAAGPRRFTKQQGPSPYGYLPQSASVHPSHSSVFRHSARNEGGGGSRESPPHLERRGSSSLDASYGGGSDSGHMHAAGSQQFVRQHPPHIVSMRASGSYPSAVAPNGALS